MTWSPFSQTPPSFISAYAQEHVRVEGVLPNDYHLSATPSHGGDLDLSFNQGGVQGHVQVPWVIPIMLQECVFGQFDQGPGD